MNLSSLSAEVLVVEDDPKIAQVVLDYLRSEGHSAQAAHDGLAAMALIRERMPDAARHGWRGHLSGSATLE